MKQFSPAIYTLKSVDSKLFGESLLATSITFNIGLIAVFIYTLKLGLLAVWMPIGFMLGIIFYAYFLLPQHTKIAQSYFSLADFLISPHSSYLKTVMICFLICNYFIYGILEIQGVRYFSLSLIPSPAFSELLILLSLAIMIVYLLGWGFEGIFHTDAWQLKVIYAGCTVLWFLSLPKVAALPLTFNFFEKPIFILQMLLGFLCIQILYAENWLRLSAFLKQADLAPNHLKHLQRSLFRSALYSFWIYSTAILLGLLAHAGSTIEQAPILAFINVLQSLCPQSSFGKIAFWILMFSMIISATLSTLDTFTITCTALLHGNTRIWRGFLILFCLLSYLCSLVNHDFTAFYVFASFILNLLIGPVLWRLFRQNSYPTAYWCLLFCGGLLITAICIQLLQLEWLGIVLLAFSGLTYLLPTEQHKHKLKRE